MTADSALRRMILALVMAALALPALAEDTIRDKFDQTVAKVEGWNDARVPLITITDGNFKAVVRVRKHHFESKSSALFLQDDCKGLPYAPAADLALGINEMNNVLYVMRNKRKLHRTKQSNAPSNETIESRFLGGACVDVSFTEDVILADRFVIDLMAVHKPPFRVK